MKHDNLTSYNSNLILVTFVYRRIGDIGVEFEGNTQPEDEGIRKTKALLEKYL